MRLGLKTFSAGLLAAVLLVPAATANPGKGNGGGGNGNGNGGGKPSWAGPPSDRGGGGGNGGGKPSWAGQGKPDFAGQGNGNGGNGNGNGDDENGENGERRASGPPAELPEQAADNPAKTCAAERALDPDAFREAYGTNENKMNAFGKCVSQEAQARGEDDEEEEEPENETELEDSTEPASNPAKTCAAERELDPEAFREAYGTNENDMNAFGKCVSQTAQAEDEDDDEEEGELEDETELEGSSAQESILALLLSLF